MTPFAIQYSDITSKEANAIIQYCILNDYPYVMVKDINNIPKDHIPVGSIDFCEKVLGYTVTPDYYPAFLSDYLFRKVYPSNEWPLGKKVFIKPADKHKRFNGFVTNRGYKGKKRPPYIISEVVDFIDEFRYYIADGNVLSGEWYIGEHDIDIPDAPKLDITFPDGYCGAVDFGVLSTGELALVEANYPFACGWYGKDCRVYSMWIISGWKYMQKQEKQHVVI